MRIKNPLVGMYFVIGICLCFIVGFLLALAIDKLIIPKLELGSSVIGTICSLITTFLAIKLYNKFRIDETIVNKKTEVVFKLIEDLRMLAFPVKIEYENGDATSFIMSYHRLEELSKVEGYNKFHDVNLLFSIHYREYTKKINDYSSNLFLPKEIAFLLKDELVGIDYSFKPTSGIVYGKICYQYENYREPRSTEPEPAQAYPSNNKVYYSLYNQKNLTVLQFMRKWDRIIKKTLEWVNLNTSTQDLNLPDRINKG